MSFLRPSFLLTLMVVLWAGQGIPRTPAWVDQPVCVITPVADGSVSSRVDLSQPLQCVGELRVISCDARNAVGFDLPIERACRVPIWPWHESRMVKVDIDGGVFELITMTASGLQTIIGSRPVDPNRVIKVPIVEGALVRIIRGQRAPVTVSVPGRGQDELRIPSAVDGGELFVGIAAQRFPPVAFVVFQNGRRVATARRSGFWAAYSGLADGQYRVQPLYLGGALGASSAVSLKAGSTAFHQHGPTPVGAVAALALPGLCNQTNRIRVLRRAPSRAGAATAEVEVAASERLDNCGARFEGLVPQDYVVEFSNTATGLLARSPVRVREDVVVDVEADAPNIRVLGRVTRRGEPLGSRAELILFPENESTSDLRAEIGAAGRFELTAPRAGDYLARVAVNGSVLVGTERRVMLEDGVNRLDWDLPGGEIRVDIDGWDRQTPAEVRLTWADPTASGLVGSVFVVNTDDNLPLIMPGLNSSQFEVAARQRIRSGETLVSRREVVNITNETPERSVRLSLKRWAAQIEVTGPQGERLPAAKVTRGEWVILPSPEPGIFEMTAAHGEPGVPILISAPTLVPHCILAPDGGRSRVKLESGTAAIVTYVDVPRGYSEPIGRLWWQGLACDLPLSRFTAVPVVEPVPTPGRISYQIFGLPSVGDVALLVGTATRQSGAFWFRPDRGVTVSLKNRQ
jgi:hypothetical protein